MGFWLYIQIIVPCLCREFYPGELTPGKFAATINTAGSVALLIQAALPIGLFCPGAVELELKGGTNTEMAPQLDFCTEVFRPNLEKFGATFDFEMIKRGYFPRGGGHCILRINNNSDLKELQPVVMTEMGRIRDCYGWSFVAGSVPMSVANEMGRGAEDAFSQSNLVDNSMKVNIECYKEDQKIAKDNCSGVIVCCETDKRCLIGGSGLGNKQEQPKQTGVKAVQEVIDSILVGACVDEHVQDQLIIFMALAKGTSRIRTGPITLHTKTAIHMCEKMTDAKFAVVADGKTFVIECQGVGLKKG